MRRIIVVGFIASLLGFTGCASQRWVIHQGRVSYPQVKGNPVWEVPILLDTRTGESHVFMQGGEKDPVWIPIGESPSLAEAPFYRQKSKQED